MSDPITPFENPIDPDQVAENPGLLPYAHNRGSAVIQPIDEGRTKGLAMEAMYGQTDMHLDQIKQQIELLAQQARRIQDRVIISEKIYQASVRFEPRIGHTYYLYRRESGEEFLSLVAPAEWGRSMQFTWQATCRLLADHTWDILDHQMSA